MLPVLIIDLDRAAWHVGVVDPDRALPVLEAAGGAEDLGIADREVDRAVVAADRELVGRVDRRSPARGTQRSRASDARAERQRTRPLS